MGEARAAKYSERFPVFPAALAETPLCGGQNPFHGDPLSKLNLRETSDFVRAFPAASVSAARRRDRERERLKAEDTTPCTTGRPLFSFSTAGCMTRKNVPSKWDDADKWIVCTASCRASPARPPPPPPDALEQEKDLLKDKFTDNVEPIVAAQRRDAATEMTPLGSSTTTRCHTPVKASSPARHNTPADRSGPVPAAAPKPGADISEISDFHFASLAASWISREEEEEDVSKSLRHFEIHGAASRSVAESRAAAWEEEEKSKICVRYQREGAKIQAWVNLQTAKAEAESRKLEVKIQRMRSNLEEKLMRKMAAASRRAEEWRAAAAVQHTQEIMKVAEQARRIKSLHGSGAPLVVAGHSSCGCIPVHPPQHPFHHRH